MSTRIKCQWLPFDDCPHHVKIELTIQGENHTLGNLLKEQLLKHKDVLQTAYTQPYPNQHLLLFFLVTKETKNENRNETCNFGMLKPIQTISETVHSIQRDLDLFQNEFLRSCSNYQKTKEKPSLDTIQNTNI